MPDPASVRGTRPDEPWWKTIDIWRRFVLAPAILKEWDLQEKEKEQLEAVKKEFLAEQIIRPSIVKFCYKS